MKLIIITILLSLSATTAASQWQTTSEQDIIEGHTNHMAYTYTGSKYAPKALLIICNNKGLRSTIINLETYLNNEPVEAIYRFDSEKPVNLTMSVSTDGDSVFIPDKHQAKFTEKLKEHSKLAIRVYDYRGTPKDQVFSLSGSTKAINKTLNACQL